MSEIKHYLLCDFETKSSVDIGRCGSFKYVESPDFEPLLLAYCFDDGPVKLWDFTQEQFGQDALYWPADFCDALNDPDITLIAHNNSFEREIIHKMIGYTPPERWLDTMTLAATCGLPLSLDAVCRALGLPEDQAKMKEGKALIRFFCVPRRPTETNPKLWNEPEDAPERWQTFRNYCVRDVEAERTVFNMLKRWLPSDEERRFACIDARINEHGVRIDRLLAERAVVMDEKYKAELTERAIAITGMDNPKSVSQIKEWLYDQEGKEFPSLNKKVIADVVSELKTEEAKEFMAIRSELSKSSTAKYGAMLRSVCKDGHVKGCFQFCGTSTGRYAGRLVQFQNLSKNKCTGEELDGMRDLVRNGHYTALKALYDGVSDPLSQLVRTAIIPEDGHKILVADFSAIEARVTAWIAGEEWALEAFRKGKDIYCETASQMFHVPVEKHGQNAELRQKGKVAVLGLGYAGGIGALKAFGADKMGMSEEEMQETIDLWRSSNPHTVRLWKSLENAAKKCLRDKRSVVSSIGNIRFDYEQGILWMTLPSGRRIAYYGAQLIDSTKYAGEKVISIMTVNQNTRKWVRQEIWRGILIENCWAAGTPVLTMRGWVPIETVTDHDLVWDGTEWSACDGAVRRDNGKPLYEVDGLTVTGDHRIMTTKGWRRVYECQGLERLSVRLPDSYQTERAEGEAWQSEEVVRDVQMREGDPGRPAGFSEGGAQRSEAILRVHEESLDFRAKNDARNVKASGLQRVALDGSALHRTNASGVEELRRAWHHGVRELAAQLRKFLAGHGSLLPVRTGHRQDQQQSQLLAGELSVDNPQGKLSEQTRRAHRDPVRAGGSGEEAGRELGHQLHDASVPTGSRLSVKPLARRTERSTPVYDVMNCGKRHCYTVLGKNGPILSHNCVQATARDILREAMFSLTEKGFDIRATVHDECICTEPIGGKTVEQMCEAMCPPIQWAEGLPLRADGYEGMYYFKD